MVNPIAKVLISAFVFLISVSVALAELSRFVGTFEGSADIVSADGTSQPRDMSVTITETKKGFSVEWTSTTRRADGSSKAKSYKINFIPSERPDVYAAAMQKNIFGHEVPLDPMKGEPYVWARMHDDTLSVYSLFVHDNGGYEIQQFDRTLAEGGLHLEYRSVRDGKPQKAVSTLLKRQ